MRSVRHTQMGVSLVEMLVGMLLSMLAIIAMLSLYRTTSSTTAESRVGVQTEARIATGLLTADKLLKSAGYFEPAASGTTPVPAYPADLLLLERVTIASGSNTATALNTAPASGVVLRPTSGFGQAILWRNRDASGTYRYEGLYAPQEGGLWRITGSGMTIDSWSRQEVLVTSPDGGTDQLQRTGQTSIALSHGVSKCRPFGIGTASGGKYSVILTTRSFSGSQLIDSQSCLVNYP